MGRKKIQTVELWKSGYRDMENLLVRKTTRKFPTSLNTATLPQYHSFYEKSLIRAATVALINQAGIGRYTPENRLLAKPATKRNRAV